jgi:hypothetical protein
MQSNFRFLLAFTGLVLIAITSHSLLRKQLHRSPASTADRQIQSALTP